MSAIEEFLAKQKRYRCERLSANITKDHCELNKRLGMVVSCIGCPGLKEMDDMATKKTCVDCGREMTIVGRGLCGGCYARAKKANDLPETKPAKTETKQPKVETKPMAICDNPAGLSDEPLEMPECCRVPQEAEPISGPMPPPAEQNPATHMINLVAMFKEKQETELQEFIKGLEACTGPFDKMRFEISCIEGLETP